MTAQDMMPNGRSGWILMLSLSGGLVLTIVGGMMNVGALQQRLVTVERCAEQETTRNRDQESRLIRLETMYERTSQDIAEIKQLLKGK